MEELGKVSGAMTSRRNGRAGDCVAICTVTCCILQLYWWMLGLFESALARNATLQGVVSLEPLLLDHLGAESAPS